VVSKQPTVISTFAGCGGSSLGYKWAGYHELLAIDFNDNAVETFKLNFDTPIWNRDIKDCTGQEILDFCGIQKGELDLLDGSPPCQGFSTAGKRNLSDERNDLFRELVRLITELQPKVFVMENVSGMIKGKYKGKFNEILQTLKDTGYNVKVKLLNAMWYEVPQSRERLIFIGVRNDLGIEPLYPEPLSRVITVKDAFAGLPVEQTRELPRGALKEIVPKIGQGETASKYHVKGNYFGTHRLHYQKPSPTIIKTAGATMNLLLHPEVDAGISINELKRLSTFPDDFKFIGDYKKQWARIGNAVMPRFMYHIAKTIKEKILDKVNG
jgi:DNA (cytosine-5)-methyltransferase 1